MELHFTPGAQRALVEAAAWTSGAGLAELEAPALLLGLLAESECRAAILLAEHAIDAGAIRQHWPRLTPTNPPSEREVWPLADLLDRPEEFRKRLPRFSDEILIALAAIRRRFHAYPRPLMLATEHLLLGLTASSKEVSHWLCAHGMDPDSLEAEIHQRSGHVADLTLGPEEPPEDTCEPLSTDPAQQAAGSEQQAADSACSGPSDDADPACSPAELALRRPPRPPTLHGPNSERVAALRVVDAAANRAMEGLRVAEDYVRFALDDRHLTGQLKALRHDLAAALACVPIASRLAARETQADVGTVLTSPSELSRPGLAEVVVANFVRTQEALRSLEEFGKILDAELPGRAKQLRYRTYTTQRAVEITRSSVARLEQARLYVLVDGGASPEAFAGLVQALTRAGVHVIQLRDKRLEDRPLLARARVLREHTVNSGTLFIMNDRPDLAVLAGADGVHVGQEELTVKEARAIVGPEALVGVSTHSLAQARQAVLDGANYLGVGPTFPSDTKHFDYFPGLELLRAVADEIRLPAFAIGGVTEENLPEVLGTGVHGIAVSGAIASASDPAAAVGRLLAAMGS